MNLLTRRPREAFAGLLLLAGAIAVSANPSAPADGELKKARQLVQQLGSDGYQEREQATAGLQKMGVRALAAIEQGLQDQDLEIRHRCEELHPEILAVDLRNRIAGFLADKDGKEKHNVPHWERYRKEIGSDNAARQLFTEMLKGEPLTLLLDCGKDSAHETSILEHFSLQMQTRMYQPNLRPGLAPLSRADLAAVLFIGGQAKNVSQQSGFAVTNMLYQPLTRTALADAATGPAFRKLLVRWMTNQSNELVIMQTCNVVQNLNLKEGKDFLLSVIKQKKVRGTYLAQVVLNLVRTGGKEHSGLLEELLTDQTALGQVQINRVRGTTEMRDVALAMLIHLNGQSHKDYGFSFLAQNPNLIWSVHYLGFSTPEEREKAHKKWQEWASKNKKKE